MPTNRVVALAGAIVTLILALLPVIADFDWRSTAGIVAGIIAVLGIVQKWLDGWQAFEARGEPDVDTGSPEPRVPQAEHVNLA